MILSYLLIDSEWSTLISLFIWLVAGSWFVLREKYCWLFVDGWFGLREKYCWLVADKPNEQGEYSICFYINLRTLIKSTKCGLMTKLIP
jgi:hypothetical protein